MSVQNPACARPVSATRAAVSHAVRAATSCQPTDLASGRTPETEGLGARALSCQLDRHRRALSPNPYCCTRIRAMPRTTRRPNCPTCGDPVHLTHHCRGRRRVDPPEPELAPPPPATIRMLIRQARDEARLAANPPEQLTIMELDQ
jgi:hypothetical protein